MGPLYLFNPFSAGTVFRRQILTSKDGTRTERAEIDSDVDTNPHGRFEEYVRT